MTKKSLRHIFSLLLMTCMMMLPYFVFAQTASNSPLIILNKVASGQNGPYAEANADTLPIMIGLIINAALSILGIIFIVLLIIAGYRWMIANGNESQVEKSVSSIKTSIIGLLIILGSWAIWNFVLDGIVNRLLI